MLVEKKSFDSLKLKVWMHSICIQWACGVCVVYIIAAPCFQRYQLQFFFYTPREKKRSNGLMRFRVHRILYTYTNNIIHQQHTQHSYGVDTCNLISFFSLAHSQSLYNICHILFLAQRIQHCGGAISGAGFAYYNEYIEGVRSEKLYNNIINMCSGDKKKTVSFYALPHNI